MKSELSALHYQNEAAAFAYVEALLWPDGPVCPHCGVIGKAGKLQGKSVRPGLWKCYACRKQFTVRINTIFESSHAPMHIWLQAFYLMCSSKKGIATRQLHRTFGGSLRTAWFLGHRIRESMKAPAYPAAEKLGGSGQTIEADETFIGGRAANRAYKPEPPKQAVFALVEREGRVRSFHVPNVTAYSLVPAIARHANSDSRFMTDEANVYMRPGTWFRGGHQTVNHAAKEYVRDDAYTNTVEGYFSVLKRGIYGCYFHVSEAHLHRYLAEFDFRYSYRVKTGFDDVGRMNKALLAAVGKRLTYRSVGGKGTAAASA